MNTLSNDLTEKTSEKLDEKKINQALINIVSKLVSEKQSEFEINNLKTVFGNNFIENCALLTQAYDLGLDLSFNRQHIIALKLKIKNKMEIKISNNSDKHSMMSASPFSRSYANDKESSNKKIEDFYKNQISILDQINDNIQNKRHLLYRKPPERINPTLAELIESYNENGFEGIMSIADYSQMLADKCDEIIKNCYLVIDQDFCNFLNENLTIILTLPFFSPTRLNMITSLKNNQSSELSENKEPDKNPDAEQSQNIMPELVENIKPEGTSEKNLITIKNISLNTDTGKVYKSKKEINFKTTNSNIFKLFEYIMKNPDKLHAIKDFYKNILGEKIYNSSDFNNFKQLVHDLNNKKLKLNSKRKPFLKIIGETKFIFNTL